MDEELFSLLYNSADKLKRGACVSILADRDSGVLVLSCIVPGKDSSGTIYYKKYPLSELSGLSVPPELFAWETGSLPPLPAPSAGLLRAPSVPYEAEDWDGWSERDVLVGSLRSRQQLAACRRNDFYYIPAERLPCDRENVRYVALLRSRRVFEEDAGIYRYGKVRSSELVKRRTIKEVPLRRVSDGNRVYCRFEIERWLPLETPILPGEFGFVCTLTNLFLLNNAVTVPELLIQSPIDHAFFTALRDCMEKRGTGQDAGFSCSGHTVVISGGQVKLYEGKILSGVYPAAEFANAPYTLFCKLRGDMYKNGTVPDYD